MEKKLQKMYPADYNILIVQDLWQAHYQILSKKFSEWIHKVKCKYGHNDTKCKTCRIKYKYCNSFLKYTNFKDDLIEQKCLYCNKKHQQKFDERLKERFSNTYKLSNHGKNKFILLLWKSVYPYEYMDDSKNVNKTPLTEKEDFHSHLNITEDITDALYVHGKIVCKDFELKNLREYHDLYLQSHTLLLADVFENFQNLSLEIHELDCAHFSSAPGLP